MSADLLAENVNLDTYGFIYLAVPWLKVAESNEEEWFLFHRTVLTFGTLQSQVFSLI